MVAPGSWSVRNLLCCCSAASTLTFSINLSFVDLCRACLFSSVMFMTGTDEYRECNLLIGRMLFGDSVPEKGRDVNFVMEYEDLTLGNQKGGVVGTLFR